VGTVQRYLGIKTGASLATGLLVGAFNLAIGLDFYILWGVLAFVLNYVPSIGSIVAAVPPVALALVQLGPGWAVAVLIVYIGVNLTIGNFIEPRILGRRLGLSPLVVILSLFFWGWVWGPAGMLLSVPMTVVVKLLLEIPPETRWLAVLLGPARDATEIPTELPTADQG
jgi:Predicted permease